MSEAPDPKWPRLLGLSVHEFRTPLTVVSGYISMLLKDTAGPLNDKQRHLLQEAAKSSARMADLLKETSKLADLEAGTASFTRTAIDLHALVAEVIAELPPPPELAVRVTQQDGRGHSMVQADRKEMKAALTSVLVALRRELVTSNELFVRERTADHEGRPAVWLSVGDAERLDALEAGGPETLTTFNEWRGGVGLSLAIARRIIDAHGGAMYSPAKLAADEANEKQGLRKDGPKAAAVVVLPIA